MGAEDMTSQAQQQQLGSEGRAGGRGSAENARPRVTIASPLGSLTLELSGARLRRLEIDSTGPVAAFPETPPGLPPVLEEAIAQLRSYFEGSRRRFDLPLAVPGTEFQRRVWAEMCAIPPGRTATYGELAARLGSSARAVGRACGDNPIPIIQPCHRVTAARGLGGYGGASQQPMVKAWLLRHEQRLAGAVGP